MQKQVSQHPEVITEIARRKLFFETNPILIKEWKDGCMIVKYIPNFIKLELNAAATFNPLHFFNSPSKRLNMLEEAVKNQIAPL